MLEERGKAKLIWIRMLCLVHAFMIPKIIHYCWFGGNPLSKKIKKYIETWHQMCPDYQIIEWNETNTDITSNVYAKEAYDAKKWAFVADYFRLEALYKYGGVYLDTDVEMIKNIDIFLDNPAFCSGEFKGVISAGIIGAEPENAWIKMLLESYYNRNFKNQDGTYNTKPTIVGILTNKTEEMYNLKITGDYQKIGNDVVLYPPNYFYPKGASYDKLRITDNTYCIHHFEGSWSEDAKLQKWLKKILGEKVGGRSAKLIRLIKKRDGSLKKEFTKYIEKIKKNT